MDVSLSMLSQMERDGEVTRSVYSVNVDDLVDTQWRRHPLDWKHEPADIQVECRLCALSPLGPVNLCP